MNRRQFLQSIGAAAIMPAVAVNAAGRSAVPIFSKPFRVPRRATIKIGGDSCRVSLEKNQSINGVELFSLILPHIGTLNSRRFMFAKPHQLLLTGIDMSKDVIFADFKIFPYGDGTDDLAFIYGQTDFNEQIDWSNNG